MCYQRHRQLRQFESSFHSSKFISEPKRKISGVLPHSHMNGQVPSTETIFEKSFSNVESSVCKHIIGWRRRRTFFAVALLRLDSCHSCLYFYFSLSCVVFGLPMSFVSSTNSLLAFGIAFLGNLRGLQLFALPCACQWRHRTILTKLSLQQRRLNVLFGCDVTCLAFPRYLSTKSRYMCIPITSNILSTW